MNPRSWGIPLLIAAGLVGTARGQMFPQPLPLPVPRQGPAPLLFVRISGDPGMRVTFYQGRPRGRVFDAPTVVGLRPGYHYRMELSNLPGHPGLSIFPSLEVFSTLCLPPRINAAAYPAPFILTEADLTQLINGSLVTKVIYLEHPDRAAPTATQVDQPLETDFPLGRSLMAEAREQGRPLLLVRMGGRILSSEEAALENVPGTILHPGEKVIPRPVLPPCLPCANRAFYDPLLGPRPSEEECLHDGGDSGVRAGFDHEGRLQGLEPEDTVAEYTDARGQRRVSCSNRVCLCVPRFAVLRNDLPLGGIDSVVRVDNARLALAQEQMRLRLPSDQSFQVEQLQGARGQVRPSLNVNIQEVGRLLGIQMLEAHEVNLGLIGLLGTAEVKRLSQVERTRLVRQVELARELSIRATVQGVEQVIGTAVIGRVEGGPQIISATAETHDLSSCCCETPILSDKPLVLIKCADRQAAQVGDVVTFTLRYTNRGGRAMTDVAVSDSLTARLEYVTGSAVSDRNAVFTIRENEVGSMVLRWEIAGRLLPGQTGTVRFQTKVR